MVKTVEDTAEDTVEAAVSAVSTATVVTIASVLIAAQRTVLKS